MDVATVLLRVKRQFGDEYGVVITDDDIYGWIYDAELDIIRTTGCNDYAATAAVNVFPFAIPDNVNVKRVYFTGPPTGGVLTYTSRNELDLMGISIGAVGEPNYWYKFDEKIWLCPQGNTTDTRNININYSKTPVVMSGPSGSNAFVVPEVYHEDIIKYCLARAHSKNNNLQAEQVHMNLYDKSLNMRRDEYQSVDAVLYKQGDPMDFGDVDYGVG